MPLKRCEVGGVRGWKYGDQGKCYTGPGSKDKALAQALAIGEGKLPKDFSGGDVMRNSRKKGTVDFKGFEDWVEIFAGGKQTDSYGREWDGDKLVDQAVSTFNADDFEPPAVIGHPQENAPAYAWVEGVRQRMRDGKKVLEAKFKQVVPEFAQMVEKGLFKKRSASFYPDGRLRHVGYLGAAPPAVKGLKDIAFDDGNGDVANFEEEINRSSIMDKGKDKDGIVQALLKIGRKDVADLVRGSQFNEEDNGQTASNQAGVDAEALADALIKKLGLQAQHSSDPVGDQGDEGNGTNAGVGTATPAFNEREIRQDERRKAEERLMGEIGQIKAEARSKELHALVNDKIRDGIIPPVFKDSGLVEFLESIDNQNQPIEFTEGAQVKQVDPVSMFIGFMEKASANKLFSEFAQFATADAGKNDKDDQLGKTIASFSPLSKDKQQSH
jgi:hypothetical protein